MSSKIVRFFKHIDKRGKLIFFEFANYEVCVFKNFSWSVLNDSNKVNVASRRKSSGEFIIALQGNFQVVLSQELNQKEYFTLNSNEYALFVANGTYLQIENGSQDAIILHTTTDVKSDVVTIANNLLSINFKNPNHTCIDACVKIDFFSPTSNNIFQIDAHLPFKVARFFYLFDVPTQALRGGHAHKKCHQVLVAVQGSFEVILDDGSSKSSIVLNQSNVGLHIPPGIWATEVNFQLGSICLVLASDVFDESDYIRDYDAFLNSKH